MSAREPVVIVGAAETTEIGRLPHLSVLDHHMDAARNAMADAGITPARIDGIASTGADPIMVARLLGIEPAYVDGTAVGGCSPLVHVRHAVAAIRAGLCTTVLVTHGESGRSRVDATYPMFGPQSLRGQFELPYGAHVAGNALPLGLARYMHETGLTHEQLAMVAVVQRQWATRNPRALRQEPITVEDVLASRYVSYPLHVLEVCLVADGGGALVITSAERAQDLAPVHRPVVVAGTGEASEMGLLSMMEDVTSSKAFRRSGRLAFEEAGIGHADVDHLMLYDPFAHVPLMMLEDLGFVGRGEAGPFVAEGNTAPGGPLPTNTNGGGLAYVHTGMYGMFAIQESVRQVRGIAPAQVADVEVSVAHGIGSYFFAAATLVLTPGDR